jgi:GNAT superfamily N-acetyltransferase
MKKIPEVLMRAAKPSEREIIAGFQIEMAKETEDIVLGKSTINAGVQAVFDNPFLGCYYVAEIEGRIIASLLITYEWSDWRAASVWWIQSVYVTPEYRRMGVFSSMYNFTKSKVLALDDVKGIRLYMVSRNNTAGRVYENLGMDGQKNRMFEWLK